jgi:hypothetical protein
MKTDLLNLGIWQEVHLAGSRTVVQCGSSFRLWKDITTAIMYLDTEMREGLKTTLPLDSFTRCVNLALGVHDDKDPLELLFMTRFTKFTNPHDRVFALLGLLDAAVVSLIDADYNQPIVEIFQKVCFAHVQVNDDVGFLEHCDWSTHRQNPGHPSWTPDWSTWRPAEIFICQSAAGYGPSRHDALNGSRCTVDGVLCGFLDKVSNEAPSEGQMCETVRDWEELVAKNDPERMEQLIESLSCGENNKSWPGSGYLSLKQYRKAFYSRDEEPIASESVRGRSIFTYGDGGMGICSPGAKTGMCEIPIVSISVSSPSFQS